MSMHEMFVAVVLEPNRKTADRRTGIKNVVGARVFGDARCLDALEHDLREAGWKFEMPACEWVRPGIWEE